MPADYFPVVQKEAASIIFRLFPGRIPEDPMQVPAWGLLLILQTARIYSGVLVKAPGWRSAVQLYCIFNRRAV
jgi:hypothetical protein